MKSYNLSLLKSAKNSIISCLCLCLFSCGGITKKNPDIGSNEISYSDDFRGEHKPKVMILGVFHFSNPGLDSYQQQFDFNILEKKRQKELEVVLNKIAEFKPTKILVEWDRIKYDSLLNISYNNFLQGKISIESEENEVYQIGYKLGKKLGHDKIYASDASSDWFGAELDWDNYNEEEYLKARGQLEKSRRYDYNSIYRLQDSLKGVQPLREHLMMINSPESRLKSHQVYLTNTILNGAGESYLGADSVARWYRRNLRIFSNVLDVVDFSKEERILLIYGSGHVWQLRQFFKDSPDFEYVEVNKYLQ